MTDELVHLALELRRHLAWQESDGTRTILQGRTRASEPGARPAAERRPEPPPARATATPATQVTATQVTATPVARAESAVVRAAPLQGLRTLEEVRASLGACQRCKLSGGRTQIVFGVGSPLAELVFVGEAPGAEEDRQGIPFVGAAGQLLTKMIEAMKFRRDDVYICNVAKCRPPNNRNPEPDEIEACEPFLKAQLAALRPKVIVALGKFAAQTLLREATPITRLRGQWRSYEGVPLMPTFHPAYLLRNPADKKLAWMDLKDVMKRFGKEP